MRSKIALLGMIALISLTAAFALLPVQAGERVGMEYGTPVGQVPLGVPLAVVIQHADNEVPGDEFIEVNGLSVKKSNYDGVILGNRTYYYCASPHMCNCPVCRGDMDFSAVELVYTDESPGFTLVVYTHPGAIDASAIETSALMLH